MTTSTWVHPSLWRVVVFALILGLAVNVMLWPLTSDVDWFANTIAVASGLCAVLLIVTWHWYTKWLDEVLLLAFTIWMANALEFALQDGPRWESQIRQCGLYICEALLALGAYVARRTNPVVTDE